jgi:hypothetical protein
MILSSAKRRVFVKTLVPTMIGTSTSPLVRGTGLFHFAALRLQELDIHIGSVDANEFATTIGKTRGRQEQKELLEIEALDRAVHRQHGVIIRYGLEQTIATPRSVDSHDANIIASAERHAIEYLFLFSRCRSQLPEARIGAEGHRRYLCKKSNAFPFATFSGWSAHFPLILAPGQIRLGDLHFVATSGL